MWGEKEGGGDWFRKNFPSISHPMAPWGGKPDTGLLTAKLQDELVQETRTGHHPPKYGCCSREGVIICQTLWYTWHAESCSEFPAIKVWLIPWPRELWLGQVQREGFIHKSRKEGLQKVRGSKVILSWETKLNFFQVIFDGVWKFSSWLRWQKCNFIQDRWWSGEMWRTIYNIPDPSHWGIYSSISYPQDIDLIFIRHRVSFPFYCRQVLASPLTFTPGTINNLVPSHREGESYFWWWPDL